MSTAESSTPAASPAGVLSVPPAVVVAAVEPAESDSPGVRPDPTVVRIFCTVFDTVLPTLSEVPLTAPTDPATLSLSAAVASLGGAEDVESVSCAVEPDESGAAAAMAPPAPNSKPAAKPPATSAVRT